MGRAGSKVTSNYNGSQEAGIDKQYQILQIVTLKGVGKAKDRMN